MRHSAAGLLRRLLPLWSLVLAQPAFPPGALAAEVPAPALRALPSIEVRNPTVMKDVGLAAELAGRPALVLLTDGRRLSETATEAAADLQREYGTWFSWVGVASGPLAAEEIQRIREDPSLRLDRFYLDRRGLLKTTLGLPGLPALLLVDENGAIRGSRAPDEGFAALEEAARTLWELAGPARWRRTGIEDFRLPQVGTAALVSFLDVAGQEGTLVAFLNSHCLACARELEVLDFARQRRGGRVSFVAVFIDPANDTRIRGFLAAGGATPDFVLRDTELRLAGRYAIRSAPAILVIDTLGRIVFTKTGYRETERDDLYADLVRSFEEAAAATRPGSVIAEARRLHEEACAFMREGRPGLALLYQERIAELLPEYSSVHLRIAEAALAAGLHEQALQNLTRYLAAAPQTYDSAAVRRMIAGLAAPPP